MKVLLALTTLHEEINPEENEALFEEEISCKATKTSHTHINNSDDP